MYMQRLLDVLKHTEEKMCAVLNGKLDWIQNISFRNVLFACLFLRIYFVANSRKNSYSVWLLVFEANWPVHPSCQFRSHSHLDQPTCWEQNSPVHCHSQGQGLSYPRPSEVWLRHSQNICNVIQFINYISINCFKIIL